MQNGETIDHEVAYLPFAGGGGDFGKRLPRPPSDGFPVLLGPFGTGPPSAELTHHLAQEEQASKNHPNGTLPKTVLAPGGELQLDVPRDRLSSFEPTLVAKYQRRMPGFDDHVISIYARGMTVREIQGHLLELYGSAVSPDLISTITDEVIEEVAQWQSGRWSRCI